LNSKTTRVATLRGAKTVWVGIPGVRIICRPPGEDAVYVRELLSDMGVYVNGKYGEEFLVHENEERLFIYGNWQPGLVPLMGARTDDRSQIERFFKEMAKFRNLRGRDGRRAFTIPSALSSADPRFTAF
jgi:hypothetical protein